MFFSCALGPWPSAQLYIWGTSLTRLLGHAETWKNLVILMLGLPNFLDRSGQAWPGQPRSAQVRSGQVRSGQVRPGQVRSGLARAGQVRSG